MPPGFVTGSTSIYSLRQALFLEVFFDVFDFDTCATAFLRAEARSPSRANRTQMSPDGNRPSHSLSSGQRPITSAMGVSQGQCSEVGSNLLDERIGLIWSDRVNWARSMDLFWWFAFSFPEDRASSSQSVRLADGLTMIGYEESDCCRSDSCQFWKVA